MDRGRMKLQKIMQGGKQMALNYATYLDKMRGCFLGKNIGGTLGAPFEGMEGIADITYYTHDVEKLGVLPNDDLDLQLVFLVAAEKYGIGVNAEVLANHWLTYIVPNWSEYGMGKRNLRGGLLPSVSGGYHNEFGESNGSWIRSEIWACLAPGNPARAVQYAYEDAIVDHFGEGIYGEIFCAAMESAAFVESDTEKLIDIGLSYIPSDCVLAQAVQFVRNCAKDPALDWKATRKKLLQAFPSSFHWGIMPGCEKDPEIPDGKRGFDTPANIGIALLGHYYGGGDFSRAICIAASCGEDSDCTAGTLGALYGILYGTAGIDEKWCVPIGDKIKTISLDRSKAGIAGTVSELCTRIARLMPSFMREQISLDDVGRISFIPVPTLFAPAGCGEKWHAKHLVLRRESPYVKVAALFDTADVAEDTLLPIELRVEGKSVTDQYVEWTTAIWHLPEGWEAVGGNESSFTMALPWNELRLQTGLIPHGMTRGKYTATLELQFAANPSRIYLPFTFYHTLPKVKE